MKKAGTENRGLAIIVMGVSGSGKSTVGPRLAERLSCAYVEGDDLHSPDSIDKMAAGIALEDEDRWPWLTRLSNQISGTIATHGRAVATCSALKRAYRDSLREQISGSTVFVHLVAPLTSLESRVSSRVTHYMQASLLQSQLDTLEPPTSDENSLVLVNDGDVGTVVSAARDWVRSLGR